MNLCKQMPAELVRERLQVLTQQRALHTRGPASGPEVYWGALTEIPIEWMSAP